MGVFKELLNEMDEIGADFVAASLQKGETINRKGVNKGKAFIKKSIGFSREFAAKRNRNAKKRLAAAKNDFIAGYLAVPAKLKKNSAAAVANLDKQNPVAVVKKNNLWRKEWAGKNAGLVSDTALGYKDNVKESLSKVEKEFLENYRDTGIAFATLKTMRWAIQAALWDLTLKPQTKMVAGSVGYLGVNLVAFPVMVVADEAKTVARIAVDVGWNSSKSLYQLTAPTAESALGAVFSCFEMTAGNIIAGSAATGGVLAGATRTGAAKAGSLVVKGGGSVLGKTIQYVGVPLAVAGVAAGGKAVGVAVEGAGKLSFGALYATGEIAAGGTDAFGGLAAGTTLVGGTAAAAAGGVGYSAFQLSKAVAVPAGYEIGAGVVLSYDNMTHIAAQSILAVADCAYLVLSLEGPRWVIYAVKGNTGKGETLSAGTVLNMKKMHQSGEEIYQLPVSDKEMKKVVQSVYETLPPR